jgi:hypothetical protein
LLSRVHRRIADVTSQPPRAARPTSTKNFSA